ncbi:MAG: tetratricopeptide repeat protein, partial [Anaerolineae bacterium]
MNGYQEDWSSIVKAMEGRFNKLKKKWQRGAIDQEEFVAEVEKLEFIDDQGRHWMIDAHSGDWYFEDEGQWVSGDPLATHPPATCSRCGRILEAEGDLCPECEAEAAALPVSDYETAEEISPMPMAEEVSTSAAAEDTQVMEIPVLEEGEEEREEEEVEDRGLDEAARRRDEQRASLFYEQGLRHFDAKEWQEALDFFEEVLNIAPAYKDAERLAEIARAELKEQEEERVRQQKVIAFYAQAEKCLADRQWQKAYDLLLEVLDLDPNYKDARSLADKARGELDAIAEKRRQLRALETLYQQGEEHFDEGRWQEAIDFFEQITDLDQAYVGLDPRYEEALTKLDEARKQRQLEVVYTEGLDCFETGQWDEAIQRFESIMALVPEYRDVSSRLEEVKRQRQLDVLYTAGEEHLKAGRWDEAIASFEELIELEPGYRDVELARLYAEGMREFTAKRWQEALKI